ncbi:putative 5' nucleotidase family protein [Monocercomonoides exilis]|uniref:putative 5' nucleotidase family protein n=1 Tax=Monocercomonoides exilis TaxID=2049356 RepID=UPI00355954AF|nr:putative 5' nucleotidase family protein [Monocercomonoides exilis]|eukprot:MONOS_13594.1-p1 / transcript=MONOS_13594.1 / gene=MONOS_13594 / organism=Monocercomonoides_exilis_PA203 / gene_product=5' nucleotidase family protein / transcript_product=5' nucleotidase family protein / location=Mono_scaffold00851:8047-10200(-) / protein_length=667 / sequence_SO=supercontig / SO=protein_coding / is_pseudo=false
MFVGFLVLFVAASATNDDNKLKFIIYHTNDVHGWVNGDKHVPERDALLSDYQNLIEHRKAALTDDEHFFAFDSGDWTQGTGLSDATSIPGEFIFDLAKNMTIDVMTAGNHELYQDACINNIADKVLNELGDRYVTANVIRKKDNKQIGKSYRTFDIVNFGNVTAFGFIFNFQGGSNNITVTKMEEVLENNKNGWVKDALSVQNLRFLVCVAHLPPTPEDGNPDESALILTKLHDIVKEILGHDLPVLFFGGHDHGTYNRTINDDYLVESGCFFKKVGQVTFEMPRQYDANTNKFENLKVNYIETNVKKMQEHLGISADKWETETGKAMKAAIKAKYSELNLDKPIGCSPQDFTREYNDKAENSLYYLLVNKVYPTEKPLVHADSNNIVMFTTNSGSLRSPLSKGEFTYDDVISIDPFQNTFTAIRDIPGTFYHKLYNGKVEVMNALMNSEEREAEIMRERAAKGIVQNWGEFADGHVMKTKEMNSLLKFAEENRGKLLNSEIKQLEWLLNGDLHPTNPFYDSELPFEADPQETDFKTRYALTNVDIPNSDDVKVDIITNSYDGPRIFRALGKYNFQGTLEKTENDTINVLIHYLQNNFKCEPENKDDPAKDKKKAVPYIIGGVIGGTVVIAVIVVVVVVVVRRQRKKKMNRDQVLDSLLEGDSYRQK